MKEWLNNRLKRPWTYWIAGVLLGVINIILMCYSREALRISGGVACAIGFIADKCGINAANWFYFKESYSRVDMKMDIVDNIYPFLTLGLVVGAMMGCLMSSQWRIRRFKKEYMGYALMGGILMGFGARLSRGCNLGALFSAIPSFSLHGWVYGIFLFVGAYIGNKILIKYRL